MMTSSETSEVKNPGNEKSADDLAILEMGLSSMAVGGIAKQKSRVVDYLSHCSTSSKRSMIWDFQMDLCDLQVEVETPSRRSDTLGTYLLFCIRTTVNDNTTRPEFEKRNYTVWRQYNDFIWLHQNLIDIYPTHIIPPIPGKDMMLPNDFQNRNYSREFIKARVKLLHIFLNRIVNHPILSCDKNLHIFLTMKPSEFLVHCKNHGNMPEKVTDSLQNITSTYKMKQYHSEFGNIRDYCRSLSTKLSNIDEINHLIHKERKDYTSVLHTMECTLAVWATREAELAPILLATVTAVGRNVRAHEKFLFDDEHGLNEEREYISYIEAVKNTLSRRDSLQIEYETTVDALSKRELERDQLIGNTSYTIPAQDSDESLSKAESRDEKLEKLDQIIWQLAEQEEILEDRMVCVNGILRRDFQRWNAKKQQDLKNMLITMADRHINHYQLCMDAWQKVLTDFKLDENGFDISVEPPVNPFKSLFFSPLKKI